MTTTACHECLTTCDLHNVTHCPTCHKHEDECGFGDCQRTAEYRLTHETGADVRQFCEPCATAPGWSSGSPASVWSPLTCRAAV